MLMTTRNKRIYDIECKKNYAVCRIEGSKEYKKIPYSAIKWVSDNWYM